MSDLDPSERDELISAYLDGEATPTERDLIANDPELLARAEHLAQIVSMITTPVTQPDHPTRETHITTALQASSTSPTITSINPAPNRRPDIMRIASIAAIVMAITLAVPLLLLNNDNQDDDTAAIENATADGAVADSAELSTAREADESIKVPEAAAAAASAESASAGDAPTADPLAAEISGADTGGEAGQPVASFGAIIDLGSFEDLDELLSELALDIQADPVTADTALAGSAVACRRDLETSIVASGEGLTIGTATLAGEPVVFVTDNSVPGSVVVLAADDCTEVARR